MVAARRDAKLLRPGAPRTDVVGAEDGALRADVALHRVAAVGAAEVTGKEGLGVLQGRPPAPAEIPVLGRGLGRFPQVRLHDHGDGDHEPLLWGAFPPHRPPLRGVGDPRLPAAEVPLALVRRLVEHPLDAPGIPPGNGRRADAALVQVLADPLAPDPAGALRTVYRQAEDKPDDLRLLRHDHQPLVARPPADLFELVAVGTLGVDDPALLRRLDLAAHHPLADLPLLPFGDGAADVRDKVVVLVAGPVEDPRGRGEAHLAVVADALQVLPVPDRAAGEARVLDGEDDVEAVLLRVGQHLQQGRPGGQEFAGNARL